MPEQFDSRYFRGQGKVFIGGRDATTGKPVGLEYLGDMTSVQLQPNVQREDTFENSSGGNALAVSLIQSVDYSLSIAMRSIKPTHLAYALQGASTAQAAASVTTETHTAKLGKFSVLQFNKVSSVVVTGTGGTPTYVAGTDYKVHADMGMIEWLSGGTITEDTATEIDYDYADQHHITTSPGNTDYYLVFAGVNSADSDKQTRCEMYKVRLDPSSIDMITEGRSDLPLSGKVQQDTLRAAGDQLFQWKTED